MATTALALLVCQSAAYVIQPAAHPVSASRATASSVLMSEAGMSRRALGEAAAAAAVVFTPLAASADGYPMISMQTTEGEMQFEMWDDVAPKHVESFLKLSKEGSEGQTRMRAGAPPNARCHARHLAR